MGFYNTCILPRILDVAMKTKAITAERQRCLQDVGVDPSETSARLARKRIAAAPFPVEMVGLSAEKIPVADALLEIRRTLSPAGRFHFVEHGQADDAAVARWQDRLNSTQKALFGGAT